MSRELSGKEERELAEALDQALDNPDRLPVPTGTSPGVARLVAVADDLCDALPLPVLPLGGAPKSRQRHRRSGPFTAVTGPFVGRGRNNVVGGSRRRWGHQQRYHRVGAAGHTSGRPARPGQRATERGQPGAHS